MAFHLELLLSDPDYYTTTSNPVDDILKPWAEWVRRAVGTFNGRPTAFGLAEPSRFGIPAMATDGRYEVWDIRWDGERCETMVMDTVMGDEIWVTPSEPAPASLMQHAQCVDNASYDGDSNGR